MSDQGILLGVEYTENGVTPDQGQLLVWLGEGMSCRPRNSSSTIWKSRGTY